MTISAGATFDKFRASGGTPAEILEFFDTLPAVTIDDMIGTWNGGEIVTGHNMEGVLVPAGWLGKQFLDSETVHPLQMDDGAGGRWNLDPLIMPATAGPLSSISRMAANAALLRAARPLLSLGPQSAARLRMLEYRGVVTATMVYDSKPINDIFRKVDDQTVLGLMDMKGDNPEAPFCFFLKKAPLHDSHI
ncbi:hypothetical protein HDU93_003115 [Gonapodya sp. JEL0774]|nr:hypothetical protein HDU93_003115 [Gonapodya sp. JEL0774]